MYANANSRDDVHFCQLPLRNEKVCKHWLILTEKKQKDLIGVVVLCQQNTGHVNKVHQT